MIEPSSRGVYSRPETLPRSLRLPDLPDRPAGEEIVNGDEDIGYDQPKDVDPDNPQVRLLWGDEAKEEKTDREPDEEDGEEVRRLRGPEPLESLRDLVRGEIVYVPSQSVMVGAHEEGVGGNEYELSG